MHRIFQRRHRLPCASLSRDACALAIALLIVCEAVSQNSVPWQLPSSSPQSSSGVTSPVHDTVAATGDSRIESYPISASTREVLLAWQRQSTGRNDIRVAIDDRSSQALVYAPAAVHEQIRRELFHPQAALPQRGSAVGGDSNGVFPNAPPATKLASIPPLPAAQLQLRYLPAAELHARIERLLARPLPITTDASGQWQGFVVEAEPGVAVTMNLHSQANIVRLDGPPAQVVAWRSVV